MLKFLSAAALIAASVPLAAQEVQLLAFSRSSDGFIRTPGGRSPPPQAVPPLADLAVEFNNLGQLAETQVAEPLDTNSAIPVPMWMRANILDERGLAAARMAAILLPAVLPSACSWEPYKPNPRLARSTEARRARYYPVMAAVACEAGVPTLLLDALVTQESRYNPSARSQMGAIGLTQLMPETARQLGVANAWDALENLRGGARYLREQLDTFGRYDLALGAYNAGPGRIHRYRGLPPFRETRNYVSVILADVRAMVDRNRSAVLYSYLTFPSTSKPIYQAK